jgi:flagellar biosynthesis protein FlhF
MPTRIKRYEDRLERLDTLLARIEAEMGPDAQLETRQFSRGKFLGLFGGQRMVEIIATLMVNGEPGGQVAIGAGREAPAMAAPAAPAAQAPVEPAAVAPGVDVRAEEAALPAAEAMAAPAASIAPAPVVQSAPQAPASLALEPAAPPAAEPAAPPPPAPVASADVLDLKSSIVELQQTMKVLIEQQQEVLQVARADRAGPEAQPRREDEPVEQKEVEPKEPQRAAKPKPAKEPPLRAGQKPLAVADPLALDTGAPLGVVQRSVYDRLVDWNIAPYDALELVNTAVANYTGDAPPGVEGLTQLVTREICSSVLLSGGIQLRKGPPGKAVALIGATGVGKTTTIAKLAAHFAFQQGRRVSLVSLDNYRIAAAEQLRTYAEIMGIDLDIVFSRDEFDTVLTLRRHNDLVLIDTAGRSPLNMKQIYELRDIFSAHPPDEVHLVIAAPTKADDLRSILENYAPLSYDYIIVSKLDETRSLGCIYNINKYAARTAGKPAPISYFTVGQSVPEDIRAAQLAFMQTWIEQGRIT